MGAEDDRAVEAEEGARRVEPRSTADLIGGLDEELRLFMEQGSHFSPPMSGNDQLVALGVRAHLATALATEHVALEIALLRETLMDGQLSSGDARRS